MAGKLGFLPFMGAFTGALAALAAAVAFVITRSGVDATGTAAGVLLIAVFFVLSSLFIIWVESVNRAFMMGAALTAYLMKLGFLLAVLATVGESGWPGFTAMIWGVAVGVLGWITGYAWWLWHAKIPYVDLDV
ncbi:MAG TPA: hypothetical protein DGG94_11120 [Micromonosporaceae bacterium]|nr:hypothetical protein [Micromonosporaceae bacterium]HCU50331.1 hypothetical protein [Micromonosporaceae bacterium]